ncbi:hypothetical protein BS78_02G041400, partial [Paspalum vaginatum]
WPTPPFLYAPTPFVAWASAVGAVVLAALALSELRGDNLAYSKFSRGGPAAGSKQQQQAALLHNRAAMLLIYAPALAAGLASFFAAAPPGAGARERERALAAALAAHFLKRVLEVLLVHRYSGTTPLATALLISAYYLSSSVAMLYAQRLSAGLPDPAVDLRRPGALVFAAGLAGNFYHHWLLSRLRANGGGKAAYKIPTGGLFGLVACPHYLFEIIGFFGFAMLSQTLYALTAAVGTAAYLAGRSYTTRKWYASKFDEFPASIKALVPYVW